MDVRFCEQQEPSPRGTTANWENSASSILRALRSALRRTIFSLDKDLSWMSGTRTKGIQLEQDGAPDTAFEEITTLSM
jgi:hypothetical protein